MPKPSHIPVKVTGKLWWLVEQSLGLERSSTGCVCLVAAVEKWKLLIYGWKKAGTSSICVLISWFVARLLGNEKYTITTINIHFLFIHHPPMSDLHLIKQNIPSPCHRSSQVVSMGIGHSWGMFIWLSFHLDIFFFFWEGRDVCWRVWPPESCWSLALLYFGPSLPLAHGITPPHNPHPQAHPFSKLSPPSRTMRDQARRHWPQF